MKSDTDLFILAILLFLIASVIIAIPLQPYMEMRAYNKLICPNPPASYFDAVFAELRVAGESNCNK